MFKSKMRAIVVPQSEHSRLAGALAFAWGNLQFDLPSFPRLSFVEGVALHDRGYGNLDSLPIGEASEDAWLEVTRRGFDMPPGDPIAGIVTRMHLLRLVNSRTTPARQALAAEMTAVIDRQVAEIGLPNTTFERADRITDFCDSVSFDFCFERPARGQVMVYPRNGGKEEVPIQYEIRDGEITITPWPLRVDEIAGYLIGYQADGYPEKLIPSCCPTEFGTPKEMELEIIHKNIDRITNLYSRFSNTYKQELSV